MLNTILYIVYTYNGTVPPYKQAVPQCDTSVENGFKLGEEGGSALSSLEYNKKV